MEQLARGVIGLSAAVWLSVAASSLPATPAVVVYDADVRGLALGAAVTVPVAASDLDFAQLAAFQFTLGYDASVLEFTGVTRGDLISVQLPGRGVGVHDPYLWALETSGGGGRIRLAALILMSGVTAGDGTLADLALARVPRSAGVLAELHFTLLRRVASPVTVVADREAVNVLVFESFAETEDVVAVTPQSVTPGGTLVTGLPNWWRLTHWPNGGGLPGNDDDGDRVANEQEYLRGTDPLEPDQRFTCEPGWNLVSLSIEPSDSSVNALGAALPGGSSFWAWTSDRESGRKGARFTTATRPRSQTGYWLFTDRRLDLRLTGAVPTAAALDLARGWNLVAPLGDAVVPDDVDLRYPWWAWDPTTAPGQFRAVGPGEPISAGAAYWVYSVVPHPLSLDR